MKHNIYIIGVTMFLALVPGLLAAQWSLVRFDEYNYFTRITTTTPNSAVVAGIDGINGGSFVLRTNDGGTTWDSIAINGAGTAWAIKELNFPDVMNGFAGGLNGNNQALLKTTDNGSTWSDITPDPTLFDPIGSVSFIDPLSGYASDGTNLYKTSDAGATWISSVPGFMLTDLRFYDMNNGYACGSNGTDAVVGRTSDGGSTWNNVLTVPIFTASSMQTLDIINPDIVFCSAQYSNILYKTNDGGISWDTITLAQIYSIQDFDFINAFEGHVLSSMGEIYGTNDGGLTWTLEYAVAGGAYGPTVFLVSISFAGTTGYVCGTSGLIKKYTVGPTGVYQPQTEALLFFPNPASSNSKVMISGISEISSLEIFDLSAQLVMQRKLAPGNHQLDLSLAKGMYTVVLTGNKNHITKILIISE